MSNCSQCGKITANHSSKYCSNKCQCDYSYNKYIDRWKLGIESGNRGVSTFNMSGHVIRYIYEKYSMECARCRWHKSNIVTGKVMLEVDHIDGNSENNNEDNLILLCPNCHSLTSNYKNMNIGNGRLWRREKYAKMI